MTYDDRVYYRKLRLIDDTLWRLGHYCSWDKSLNEVRHTAEYFIPVWSDNEIVEYIERRIGVEG